MDLAECSSQSGEPGKALAFLERAAAANPDPQTSLRILINKGSVLVFQRKLNDAEPVLVRAIDAAKKSGDVYHLSTATLNLSANELRQGNFDRALQLAKESASAAESIGALKVLDRAYLNIGVALYRLGDFDSARQQLSKTVKLCRTIGDTNGLSLAVGNLGNVFMLDGRFRESIAPYTEGYRIALDAGNQRNLALWSGNIASAAIEAGNWDEAEKWNAIANKHATAAKEPTAEMMNTINEASIAHGRGRYREAIDLFERALDQSGANPGLHWEIHSSLGQAYLALDNHEKANSEFEAALKSIEQTRSGLDSSQKITLLSRLIRFYQSYVDALVAQKQFDKALEVADSSRARVLLEKVAENGVHSSSAAAIRQDAADSNTYLIAFWIAPDRSFAWLITPGGPALPPFTLPPAAEVESLVNSYRENVEGNPLALKDDGSTLWRKLLGGIAPRIPKGSRVVVIPDGPLHRLNLETLRTPEGRYWLEDVIVTVAPSLSVLSVEEPRPPSNSVLLIGAPTAANPDFPPLPNAPSEIAGIKELYASTAVFEGAEATPTAYRSAGPARFSLIHFAAHAQANRENPLESAVILSRASGTYKLYARDVVDIPIQADLVTISGCRSAGVRAYNGEGLIGFAWAFLRAGARNVVAGLWDVSDTSTAPLMTEFYKAMSAGSPPADALHRAKLALLNGRYAKPYYWAPFQAYTKTLQRSRPQLH
jgi:CHAT domain-containing protein/Flp pilus assembly protein TadD